MRNLFKKAAEPRFAAWWVSMLWKAMQVTGNGYQRPSVKPGRYGVLAHDDERRKDKLDTNKHMRRYQARFTGGNYFSSTSRRQRRQAARTR